MKNKIIEVLENSKLSSDSGFIVLFDGERIRMKSGKVCWNKRHEAVNALIGSVKELLGTTKTWENNTEMRQTLKDLEQEGRIQIVEIAG